ncbi:unnamed protein product [Rhizoctonia solani]|uniref:Uncharacterized protein n=1 Tax=Rhizoctonia solani TaxID=456999 RepID=A0A8H3A427_9AGAM|nr:unnamed protein product [Rhizoctonia solani]
MVAVHVSDLSAKLQLLTDSEQLIRVDADNIHGRDLYSTMASGDSQFDASNSWPYLEPAKCRASRSMEMRRALISIQCASREASAFDTYHAKLIPIDRFLYTLAYGENSHILLEDRKSLERPAALEKIRLEQEAVNQAAAAATPAPAIEDDDVVIIDATGQEPGAVLPKVKKIPLPLHFRTTFISLRAPSTFEQFLGQVKAKWTEYLPMQIPPPTTDGQPPAILAEFVASIVPQSHADYTFLPVRFSEQQWSEVLDSADDAQPRTLGTTEGEYSHGFEYATPRPSDWGSGFTQERRSAFLLLRMLLDEKLLA